jgi:hypothetical protein
VRAADSNVFVPVVPAIFNSGFETPPRHTAKDVHMELEMLKRSLKDPACSNMETPARSNMETPARSIHDAGRSIETPSSGLVGLPRDIIETPVRNRDFKHTTETPVRTTEGHATPARTSEAARNTTDFKHTKATPSRSFGGPDKVQMLPYTKMTPLRNVADQVQMPRTMVRGIDVNVFGYGTAPAKADMSVLGTLLQPEREPSKLLVRLSETEMHLVGTFRSVPSMPPIVLEPCEAQGVTLFRFR